MQHYIIKKHANTNCELFLLVQNRHTIAWEKITNLPLNWEKRKSEKIIIEKNEFIVFIFQNEKNDAIVYNKNTFSYWETNIPENFEIVDTIFEGIVFKVEDQHFAIINWQEIIIELGIYIAGKYVSSENKIFAVAKDYCQKLDFTDIKILNATHGKIFTCKHSSGIPHVYSDLEESIVIEGDIITRYYYNNNEFKIETYTIN